MKEEKNKTSVSIFTPTFNREDHIGKLYDSLCNQDVFPVEWIVIDDGNDGTEKKILEWKKSSPFTIIYIHKTGEKGINRSFNEMINWVSGTLVMKVDDDDYLTHDAIKSVIKVEKTIQGREWFSGVAGLRSHQDGRIIGDRWRARRWYIDATNFERVKCSLRGDKAEAYYTTVLKNFLPFPEYKGEYYTWEGLLWDRIAHAGYKLRWFKKVIYITEYLPGGASSDVDSACMNNINTYTQLVQEKINYKEINVFRRLHMLVRYYEICRLRGDSELCSFGGHYTMCEVGKYISRFTVKHRGNING